MKIKGLQDVDELRRNPRFPSQPPRMISAKTFVEQQREGSSCIENEFAVRWLAVYPDLPFKAELVFSPTRGYRFDFAWPEAGIAVELQGQIWKKGAHSSGVGITRDCQKNLHAAILGWQVLPLTPEMAKDRAMLSSIAKLIRERRK